MEENVEKTKSRIMDAVMEDLLVADVRVEDAEKRGEWKTMIPVTTPEKLKGIDSYFEPKQNCNKSQ